MSLLEIAAIGNDEFAALQQAVTAPQIGVRERFGEHFECLSRQHVGHRGSTAIRPQTGKIEKRTRNRRFADTREYQLITVVIDDVRETVTRIDRYVDAAQFVKTVNEYNAAVKKDVPFNHTIKDGKGTTGIEPPKSNWAHPVDRAPFHAYPIISSNVFTFGGLKVDSSARVLNTQGDPIPGLYAAGEIIGSYYRNYTGATSVLKGAVFGKIAGSDAAKL